MKKNQTNQTTPVTKEEKANTGWILIALPKTCEIKRTETYLLFDVDGQASGIVSAKFIRKKESDTHLFISMPEEYEVNCRVREPDQNGKFRTIKEYVIKAKDLRSVVRAYEKKSKQVPEDTLPF